MANAAEINLGPYHLKFLQRLPKEELSDRAERLRDTALYEKGLPLVTLGRYHRARQIRDVLLHIVRTGGFVRERIDAARRGAIYFSRIPSPAPSDEKSSPSSRIRLPMIETQYYAKISRTGQIAIAERDGDGPQFFEEFTGALASVNATSIRCCKLCKRIFWADRRDKEYCSDSCRMRHWRAKNPVKVAVIQSRYDKTRERSHSPNSQDRGKPRKASEPLRPHPQPRIPTKNENPVAGPPLPTPGFRRVL